MKHEHWDGFTQSTCNGKKAMGYEDAMRVVRRKDGPKRVAYKCKICRRWHVGGVVDRGQRTLKGKK